MVHPGVLKGRSRMIPILLAIWGGVLVLRLVAINPYLLFGGQMALNARAEADRLFQFTDPSSRKPPASTPVTSLYRGDVNRDGQAAGYLAPPLREAWHTDNLNIGVHSASKSSPAVDASGVYLGADSGWFYAYDLDGKLRWKFATGASTQGIHGTAALDENYVYIGAYNGRFYCLRKSDGHPVWAIHLADAAGSSAVIEGGRLWISAEFGGVRDGLVFCLNRETGEVLWRSARFGEQVHSSPSLDPVHRRLYVGANNGNLYAFDSDQGEPLWTRSLAGPIKSTPVVIDGVVYATSWGKRFWAVDGKTGEVLWSVPLRGKSQSSPVYFPKEDVFVFMSQSQSGHLYGVGRKERRILWEKELRNSRPLSSATGALDNQGNALAWTTCNIRELCAISPRTGKIVFQAPLPGALTGAPAVFGTSLYVSLDSGPLMRWDSD